MTIGSYQESRVMPVQSDAPGRFGEAGALRLKAELKQALRANQPALAAELCRALLAYLPESVELLMLAGALASQTGEAEQALQFFRGAAALQPALPEAHNNQGVLLQELGRLPEAEAAYRAALRLRPAYAEAHCNLGNTLNALGQDAPALDCYRAALSCDPRHQNACYNLANALRAQGEWLEAVEVYRRLLGFAPRHLPGWLNLGGSLLALNRFEDALEASRRALEIDPACRDAHWNRALALLATGDYPNGWREYEWRLSDTAAFPATCAGRPRWDGSPLAGRTLLLRSEQGFGDTLQFYRYARLMARAGHSVILECRPELLPIFASQGEPLRLLAAGEPPPHFDTFAYLLSLPHLLGTTLETIPAEVPYLKADAALRERWRAQLGAPGNLKVGLVWAGSAGYQNDRYRSLPLGLLAPLADLAGVELYSLQLGEAARELSGAAAPAGLRDLSPGVKDFADTAAIIDCLDLVVSVDTAVAHLAGALGKRVFLMLPNSGDWRWLFGREDSPWYPTLRLYRQESAGDWEGLVAALAGDLARELADLNCQFRRANALGSAGRSGEAIDVYRWILARWPGCAEVHNNLGLALQDAGRPEEAAASYRQALQLQPGLADAWNNLGTLLVSRDDREAALPYFRQALALEADHRLACVNLGSALQQLGRPQEALPLYQRVLARNPGSLEARINLGTAYQDLMQPRQALGVCREALELDPHSPEAHWNLALSLLSLGEYRQGWQEYEWRFRRDAAPAVAGPYWDGAPLSGASILIWCEQGLGDTLQFVRYAPLVAARGGRVLLRCQSAALKPLLAGVPGVAAVFGPGDELPPFDCHAPLLSLPRIFGVTLEGLSAEVPYLFPDPARVAAWRGRLPAGAAYRVGLVWKGGPLPRNRACPFAEFAPLAGIPGVAFFSLQLGEAPLPGVLPILDLAPELSDFAESAALIANLDLVISVDTACAHLAGGMGVPVWTLLPWSCDWRWLADRDDSPWYPSMTLIRQHSPGDWRGVLRAVAARLSSRPTGKIRQL